MATGVTGVLPQPLAQVLPPRLAQAVALACPSGAQVEEIRLRAGRPLELTGVSGAASTVVTTEDIHYVLNVVTQSSVYAWERELRQGFVTLAGGHRIGFSGRAVTDGEGRLVAMRDFNAVCIRVARAFDGIAARLSPYLFDSRGQLLSTLLVGPPLSGKTTLLRDVVRQLGDGTLSVDTAEMRVGLVDERSEIAGCVRGIPQFDVGLRTDVLDACPKVEGMYMLLRAMAPQVLVTDEIGSEDDARAILDASRAGVAFVGSVHGSSAGDLRSRPALRALVDCGAIERYVFLRRAPGAAPRVVTVCDGRLREIGPGFGVAR